MKPIRCWPFSDVQTNAAGLYSVIIRSDYGPVTTTAARLTVRSPPAFAWARQIGGTNSQNGSSAVGVDAGGNIYLAGYFYRTNTSVGNTVLTNMGGQDIFLAKLDPSGRILWVRQIAGSGEDEARGLALDAAGNLYVTGVFSGAV